MPNRSRHTKSSGAAARRGERFVAVLAYDGVNVFELGLAVEVFGLTDMGSDWYRVLVCSERPAEPIRANNGIKIIAETGLQTLSRAHTIIVPGWAPITNAPPAALLAALRRAHRRGARVASICAGVFVLAAAGLLDGKRAAAHWAQADALARGYPSVQVDPSVLYVDDGNIMSSAGRTAGLDLCLHIVRQDYGVEVANRVAQRLVIASHREGGQAQFIPQPVCRIERGALAPLFEWARQHLDQDLSISRLAARVEMSRRTFIRRCKDATGRSPGEWVVEARISRARDLLETTSKPIEIIATEAGLGSADAMRHHFRILLGTSPARYRSAFRSNRRYDGM